MTYNTPTQFKPLEEDLSLLEMYESSEWKQTEDLEVRKKLWKQAAENTIKSKRKRISIAVDQQDLSRIKSQSLAKGVPYQTYINMILRKVARTPDFMV